MKKLTNNNKSARGFTIVELLVVIVVIGILAAITIVSYTGITAKANNSKALSNAQSAQQVAEVMNTDIGHYPRASTDFGSGTTLTKLPAGICVVTSAGTGYGCTSGQTALSAANGLTTIFYQYCGAVAAPATGAEIGGRIQIWDFTTGAVSSTVTYLGTGASGLGVGSGTTCNTWVTPTS